MQQAKKVTQADLNMCDYQIFTVEIHIFLYPFPFLS